MRTIRRSGRVWAIRSDRRARTRAARFRRSSPPSAASWTRAPSYASTVWLSWRSIRPISASTRVASPCFSATVGGDAVPAAAAASETARARAARGNRGRTAEGGARLAGRRLAREPTRLLGGGQVWTAAYTESVQEVLSVSNDVAAELAGISDGVLDALRDRLGCTILLRGNRLTIEGDEERVAEARAVIDELAELVQGGHEIGPSTVDAVVAALAEKQVGRIILTRPAVEAGERLGFLPGDMLAKVDPYLRPLFDALYDMLDAERLNTYMERGTIEVAPLAFMRGRTFNDSFITLDEAQNTGPEQMQMFLTRLGFGSKVVVTGDVTQVDLPREQASGLIHVQSILGSIDGIAFIRFGHEDVVRHKLVQRIVEAYKLHAEETGTQRRK